MAYFDQNQDLWIEVDCTHNPPVNLQTSSRIEVVPDYHYHPYYTHGQQLSQPCKAVTYMNLTRYISELRLTKIIQEITKDNQ